MDEPRGHPDAILRPSEAEQAFTVDRVPASAPLAELVDYHWYVGWRTPEPHRQQVVPQPRIHLAAEHGRLLVHGISREPFFRTLTGTGHTIGAAFHPGGFRPFLGRSVGGISGSVVPAGDLLGVDDRPVAAYVLGDVTVAEMVAALEEYLLSLDPAPDPAVARCGRWSTRPSRIASSPGSSSSPTGPPAACDRCSDCSPSTSGSARSG